MPRAPLSYRCPAERQNPPATVLKDFNRVQLIHLKQLTQVVNGSIHGSAVRKSRDTCDHDQCVREGSRESGVVG